MSNDEITYWDCDDACENLSHETPEEAVDDWLDSLSREEFDGLTGTVTVYGYRRMKIRLTGESIATHIMEGLDEDFAGPDRDRTEPSSAIKAAADALCAAVHKDYQVWACENVKAIEFDVTEAKAGIA